MYRQSRSAILRILLVLPALLVVAACTTTSGGPASGATPTATALPPTATATPKPTTCAQLPGMSGASTLALDHMAFPAQTFAPMPTTSAGGIGQFTIHDYQGCTQNNTTDLVVTSGKGPKPFTSLLGFYGWGNATTFPADGWIQKSCGAAKCFLFGDGTEFLALDTVTDHGNGLITFHLRLALPPAIPACDPATFTDPAYHTTYDLGGGVVIPLPPLSRLGRGDGAAGSLYTPVCSAGTVASINAFLAAALPTFGWQPNPAAGTSGWKQSAGGLTYTFEIQSLSDPKNWVLRTHHPM